jgi:hypothetical protein
VLSGSDLDEIQHAGVAATALGRLELGQGVTVSTLVSVIKAFGQTRWLDALQPPVTRSPLQMPKSARKRQRAGSPHKPTIQPNECAAFARGTVMLRVKNRPETGMVIGAAGGDRTHDPWLRRPILYPLSYSRNAEN